MLGTFLVSCCLEQYKLVPVFTSKGVQDARISCRRHCSDHGMVLMALDSDLDRQGIVELSEYRKWMLVITDGMEVVTRNSNGLLHYTYFSRLGGKNIRFIDDHIEVDHVVLGPGIYSLILHKTFYFSEYYFYGEGYDEFHCACKLPGEWCPFNCHDDFDASKKLLSRNSTSSVSCHL